jgi:tetratricopeptide (TPR) repeat protein
MKRKIFKTRFIITAALLMMFSANVLAQDLKSAILLTKSEQYDKAGEMLQQLMQKEPANSKYYFYLGENILLEYYSDTISNSLTEFTNRAKEIFQKGISANPNDPLNYIGLAKVATYLNDIKTAEEMRTKARSYLLPYKKINKKMSPPAPDYAFALAKIAESFIKENEVDTAAALPFIREAIKIDAKNPEIYLIAGDIYILATDGTSAIRNYSMAQYYDPESPTANIKKGNIYVRGKNPQAAIPLYEDAIGIDPDFAPAYRELGELYWRAGRNEQSKANYKKYLELTQGNIPAQTRYVNSLFYAGDYEEVIKNVEEIFAVDKSRYIMNRLAGYSSFELASKNKTGDYSQALAYMEELFKALPEERILWKDHHYMARILMRKNQNYPAMLDELSALENRLTTENRNLAAASTAAAKAKIQPTVDELTAKVTALKADVSQAEKELDRGFSEFEKVSEMRAQDRAVLSEMATNYYNNRRYDKAAKTLARMIDPNDVKIDDLMQVGRAYYNGEKFTTADSVFSDVIKRSPDHVPAYLWIARTHTRLDPDYKTGAAKPKFDQLVQVAKTDSLKYDAELAEAFGYLGYYYSSRNEYNKSKDIYNRWVNLNPNNNDHKIRAYQGLGALELQAAGNEQTIEGRLAILARSRDAFGKILELDPNNASAKTQLNYVRDFEAQVRKGINPNEIKGVVSDAATKQPIPFASVRVKDTAAEARTNSKGEYKFEIPQSSEALIVSAQGYQSKEVPITKSRSYNVSLEK